MLMVGGPAWAEGAEVPGLLSLQGYLRTTQGQTAADGEKKLCVELYSTAAGPLPLYQETVSVSTTGGRFATSIGAGGAFGGAYADLGELMNQQTVLYLAAHLDDCEQKELGNRQPVNTGAYALRARRAQQADGLSLSCNAGQILAYNGTGWACGDDQDTDTTYAPGTGLHLEQGVFEVDLAWANAAFVPRGEAASVTSEMIAEGAVGLAHLGAVCAEGEVLAYQNGFWACRELGAVFATDEEVHARRLPEVAMGLLSNQYDRWVGLSAPVALQDLENKTVVLSTLENGVLLNVTPTVIFAHPQPTTPQVTLTYESGAIKQLFTLQEGVTSLAKCPAPLTGQPLDCLADPLPEGCVLHTLDMPIEGDWSWFMETEPPSQATWTLSVIDVCDTYPGDWSAHPKGDATQYVVGFTVAYQVASREELTVWGHQDVQGDVTVSGSSKAAKGDFAELSAGTITALGLDVGTGEIKAGSAALSGHLSAETAAVGGLLTAGSVTANGEVKVQSLTTGSVTANDVSATSLRVHNSSASAATFNMEGHTLTLQGVNDPVAYGPHLPYIQWLQADETRAMYLGWGNSDAKFVNFQLENGYELAMNGGNVGIGLLDPQAPLHVAGNARVDGSLEASGTVQALTNLSGVHNLVEQAHMEATNKWEQPPNPVIVTWHDGRQIRATQSTETGTGCYGGWGQTNLFRVHPDRTYEFSVWIKSSGVDMNNYLGFYVYDANGARIVGNYNNPYFKTTEGDPDRWVRWSGLLLPSYAPQHPTYPFANSDARETNGTDWVMPAEAAYAQIRFGACYGNGDNLDASWFAMPRVVEMTGERAEPRWYRNSTMATMTNSFGLTEVPNSGVSFYAAAGTPLTIWAYFHQRCNDSHFYNEVKLDGTTVAVAGDKANIDWRVNNQILWNGTVATTGDHTVLLYWQGGTACTSNSNEMGTGGANVSVTVMVGP
jgi:hypothetical protein